MKLTFTYLLISFFFFTSCSSYTYYYSEMNSNDPFVSKNEQGEFVFEGDSIDVIYNFNGENAPITVGVYNRKSNPVYIDWRKSGVIIGDELVTYKEPFEIYAIRGDTTSANYGRYLNDPDGLSTVKAETRLDTQVLELANFNFDRIPENQFKNNQVKEDDKGNRWKYKSIQYTEDDSPIYLESFLAIYEKANDLNDPFTFDGSFYMSELANAGALAPTGLSVDQRERGDFFYVKKEKNKKQKEAKNTKKKENAPLKVLNGVADVTGRFLLWVLGDVDYD